MNSDVLDQLRQCQSRCQAGEFERAREICEEIVDREPEHAGAHHLLGIICLQTGDSRQAVENIKRATQLDPGEPEYHNSLGIAYSTSGEFSKAVEIFRKVVTLSQGNAIAHSNLGNACRDLGNISEAVGCYREAISKNPEYIQAYIDLGDLLRKTGQLEDGIAVYRQALVVSPDSFPVRFQLAIGLINSGDFEEAERILRKLAVIKPDYPGLQNNLGLALMKLGRSSQAIECFTGESELNPNDAIPYNSKGNALKNQNDLEGAIQSFREALARQPDYPEAHSNLLLSQNYLDIPQETIYRESVEFDARQSGVHSGKAHGIFDNPKDRDKVLRIGYVSPDFRSHSVAHFTRALVRMHDRKKVEVFCYANVLKQDAVTKQFEAEADHWLSVIGMTDSAVAERIRQDKIDILIDLAGHTAGNRLPVFAYRPAPVQATWLGYPNTTGLPAMNYRLTDEIADPVGDADDLYTEKLVRLPGGFLCYQTDVRLPEVSAAPCLTRRQVTFGSLNNLNKIGAGVIRVWSGILRRVEGSRMLMKSEMFSDDVAKKRCLRLFEEHGIPAERLVLMTWANTREEHLKVYSGIDIGLDPFPYNGTTTTCEALWMGVPVISLRGNRHASRVGASILHHAGFPDLVADSEKAYMELAQSLAGDLDRLTNLRQKLREQLKSSRLMDLESFTAALESAYRGMWATWCDGI